MKSVMTHLSTLANDSVMLDDTHTIIQDIHVITHYNTSFSGVSRFNTVLMHHEACSTYCYMQGALENNYIMTHIMRLSVCHDAL